MIFLFDRLLSKKINLLTNRYKISLNFKKKLFTKKQPIYLFPCFYT